jgi:thiamine-monophosphate kinase
VDGVHFDRRWLSWYEVGWRANEAAVSDLAAMGAEPIAALSALTLPRGFGRKELAALGRGQAASATRTGCPVIGGNISAGPGVAIATTVLGRVSRPLRRDAARPGHELWLVGDVGLARTGLGLLRKRKKKILDAPSRRAVRAWRRPRALLEEGLALVGRARAAIDVSDGLGGDLCHICRASQVKAIVESDALIGALPRPLFGAAKALGVDALEQALSGGEDYALVATGPAKLRPDFARRIGRVERGEGAWLEQADGNHRRLGGGFDHLS